MIKARKIDQTLKINQVERKWAAVRSFLSAVVCGKKNICSHVESDDECAWCQGSYNEGEEWLCSPVYHQWYHAECFYK